MPGPTCLIDTSAWIEYFRKADILVHACARRHGVTILHCDKHFDVLANLIRLG